jgi:hypothetical protein
MGDGNYWQYQADKNYQAIKSYYLSKSRTNEQWQAVTKNPHLFNRVWRSMLKLPINDMPPPKEYRQLT